MFLTQDRRHLRGRDESVRGTCSCACHRHNRSCYDGASRGSRRRGGDCGARYGLGCGGELGCARPRGLDTRACGFDEALRLILHAGEERNKRGGSRLSSALDGRVLDLARRYPNAGRWLRVFDRALMLGRLWNSDGDGGSRRGHRGLHCRSMSAVSGSSGHVPLTCGCCHRRGRD